MEAEIAVLRGRFAGVDDLSPRLSMRPIELLPIEKPIEAGPEKAGVGGSIPSLATI
jgi:hypothetical protein